MSPGPKNIPERPSLVIQMVKNLPGMLETWVQSLGWEDPLKKEMATLSSYSCLGNHMDGGSWRPAPRRVSKSQAPPSRHAVVGQKCWSEALGAEGPVAVPRGRWAGRPQRPLMSPEPWPSPVHLDALNALPHASRAAWGPLSEPLGTSSECCRRQAQNTFAHL